MGMTSDDLKQCFSEEGLKRLYHWMRGQTGAICEGREWDYATSDYIDTDCGPHGMVIYRHDVQRFIDGEPVID
jgi:hypothetical protein